MKFLLLFLSSLSFSAEIPEKDFSAMKTQFQKAFYCRLQKAPAEEKDIAESTGCFAKLYSKKISDREQAGMAYWFTVTSFKQVTTCDAAKYSLKSYSRYSTNHLCVSFSDVGNKTQVNVVFFEKEDGIFKISGIYKPRKLD
jgi:hypothetical protein